MRPIPIPGDDDVKYGEVISLNFLEAGTFKPLDDPTAFNPPLIAGHYPKGDDGRPHKADHHEHFLKYEFTPDHKGAIRVMHTIHISNVDNQ